MRISHIEDGITLVPQPHPCITSWQKTARPIGSSPADTTTGAHDDKRRQIPGHATETIGRPRPDAGTPRLGKPGIKQYLSRRMIKLIRVDGFNQRDVIGHPGQMRQHLAEFHPALTMTRKLELRSHDIGVGPDKSISLTANDRRRQRLAVVLHQRRLVVKHLQLRRSPSHE